MSATNQSTNRDSEGEWLNLGPGTNFMNVGNLNRDSSMSEVKPENLLSNCSLLANSMYSMHNTIRKSINWILFIQLICIVLLCISLTFIILNSNTIKKMQSKQIEVSTS